MIGAGAIITKNVPAFALIIGNPAHQSGWVSEAGFTLQLNNGIAICPGTGKKYQLTENGLHNL